MATQYTMNIMAHGMRQTSDPGPLSFNTQPLASYNNCTINWYAGGNYILIVNPIMTQNVDGLTVTNTYHANNADNHFCDNTVFYPTNQTELWRSQVMIWQNGIPLNPLPINGITNLGEILAFCSNSRIFQGSYRLLIRVYACAGYEAGLNQEIYGNLMYTAYRNVVQHYGPLLQRQLTDQGAITQAFTTGQVVWADDYLVLNPQSYFILNPFQEVNYPNLGRAPCWQFVRQYIAALNENGRGAVYNRVHPELMQPYRNNRDPRISRLQVGGRKRKNKKSKKTKKAKGSKRATKTKKST